VLTGTKWLAGGVIWSTPGVERGVWESENSTYINEWGIGGNDVEKSIPAIFVRQLGIDELG
jgi:hypothetical protein